MPAKSVTKCPSCASDNRREADDRENLECHEPASCKNWACSPPAWYTSDQGGTQKIAAAKDKAPTQRICRWQTRIQQMLVVSEGLITGGIVSTEPLGWIR